MCPRHALCKRGVETVLHAYNLVFGIVGRRRAMQKEVRDKRRNPNDDMSWAKTGTTSLA